MAKKTVLTAAQREVRDRLLEFIEGVRELTETHCKNSEEAEMFLSATYVLEQHDPVFGVYAPAYSLKEVNAPE